MTSMLLRDMALRQGENMTYTCDLDSQATNPTVGFLLTLGAGLSTSIGALFAFCIPKDQAKGNIFLSVSLAVAAGVMIYISFVEIYADKTFSSFRACIEDDSLVVTYGTLCFFLGIFLTWLLHFFLKKFEHLIFAKNTEEPMEDPPEGQDEDQIEAREQQQQDKTEDIVDFEDKMASELFGEDPEEGEAVDKGSLARMGLFTALAIALHNFPEGLATFVAAMDDTSLGVSVAIAIAFHNIPEGVCVAVPIYFASGSKWKAFLVASASGLTEILGAFLGWLVLREVFNQIVFGVLFGLVSGMMTFVAIKELLPQARKVDKDDKWTSIMCFVGMFIMGFSLMLFKLVGAE